jgi:alkylation response protein AidB-like acyl-CoA dehydrogenase
VTETLRAVEAVSAHDASTGWVVAVANAHHVFTGYLDEDVVRQVFVPGTPVAAHLAPVGRARAVERGYVVSRQWPYTSGNPHADWLIGGIAVESPDGAATDAPLVRRLALIPRSEAELIEAWDVAGLRATGSHDFHVDDVFVPAKFTCQMAHETRRRDDPLFAFPLYGWLAVILAPLALGISRRALDEVDTLASVKTPARGDSGALRQRSVVQHEFAQAEAKLRSAQVFLYNTCDEVTASIEGGGAASDEQRALLRLATTYASSAGAEATTTAYRLGGDTSNFESSVLQRLLRDVNAVTQHHLLSPLGYELSGQTLLGGGLSPGM